MLKNEQLTQQILKCAYDVHSALGPGLLEKVYEECLFYDLKESGLRVERQVEIPVEYKRIEIDAGFRIDILVEDEIVLELKSVSSITDIHKAQIINYINLMKKPKGILVNFNVKNLYHDGQETFVNKYYETLR